MAFNIANAVPVQSQKASAPARTYGPSPADTANAAAQADIKKAAPIELAKSGADKLAEFAANNQRLVDVIRNAEQGMALLKPQEFANKDRPEMPTKYGTHLGGGFPALRESYQDYIGNDPTLRGLQGVAAKAQLGTAQENKGQGSTSDFERRLYGISAKVDPFRYDEAQNYQALHNQKMRALELQNALKNEATFKPEANLMPNNAEQQPYSPSGNNEIQSLVDQYTKPMVKP
jgi:hypothetical protein